MIADHKYGTAENFVACQERGITTHLGDALGKAQHGRERTIFGDEAFTDDPLHNIYRCQRDFRHSNPPKESTVNQTQIALGNTP